MSQHECGYTALWRAVLTQALRDIERPGSKGNEHDIAKVIAWVGGQDFYTVCNLAEMNPEMMEARFKRALEGVENAGSD